MQIPLLKDIVIIFGLSIIVLFIFHRLKIPSIVGFLITGILAGPHGFRLVNAVHEVEILAEIGVIFLLFTIGIEFSLKELLRIKKIVLIGGSIQVVSTILVSFAILTKIGIPSGESIFISFLISLSSTAIVLKLIQEKSQVESPYGQVTLGILIFQDIAIVPMMLFVPLLSGTESNISLSLFQLAVKGIIIILIVIASAKWIVPKILFQIARTHNRELFLLSVVVICFGIAWMTSSVGLSLALGAFLAGLIISESEYGHQILGNIIPIRDIFTSFFFVSVGMLLNLNFLLENPLYIVLITLSVIMLKTILGFFTTLILKFHIGTAILVGFALCQIGEFSFILSRVGLEYNIIDKNIYQMFLAVSIITMICTPFILIIVPGLSNFVMSLPLGRKIKCGFHSLHEIKHTERKNHLIVIGFGVNGRNLTRAAKANAIPYVIIEMNPETVREEKRKGEPIYFGDATHREILRIVNIKNAKIASVVISDPAATRRIVELLRLINPAIHIIARTRLLSEMAPLLKLGADEVIPEEFETSIEIFTRVLRKYLVPRNEIEKCVSEIRSESYEMLRLQSKESITFSDLNLNIPDVEISSYKIGKTSPIAGKTLAEIELRKKYGVTLLVIHRDGNTISTPGGNIKLCVNDILIIIGPQDKIIEVSALFHDIDE